MTSTRPIALRPGVPPPPPTQQTLLGLDLGQRQDWTALAVVQRTVETRPAPDDDHRVPPVRPVNTYAVVQLDRIQGRSYEAIADAVVALKRRPELQGATLILDETGVGTAIADTLDARGLRPERITITGGDAVTQVGAVVPRAQARPRRHRGGAARGAPAPDRRGVAAGLGADAGARQLPGQGLGERARFLRRRRRLAGRQPRRLRASRWRWPAGGANGRGRCSVCSEAGPGAGVAPVAVRGACWGLRRRWHRRAPTAPARASAPLTPVGVRPPPPW